MRIATWNVNGLRARLDFVLHWLREREPDVVGLQELKLSDDKFPHEVFAELGYQTVTHGQKSWNGVAVLSRPPVTQVRAGLPGQQELGARLITARIGEAGAADELSFTTVYCPNGKHVGHDDYPRKLAWFDALRAHWLDHHPPAGAAVLCGDFNVVPEKVDSWHAEDAEGEILHTPDERARISALLDAGLVDLFRERNPDAQAFSWWDYRGGAFHRRQGLRIDLLLATRSALDRVGSVEIDRDYRKKKEGLTPSDHAPVIADLD